MSPNAHSGIQRVCIRFATRSDHFRSVPVCDNSSDECDGSDTGDNVKNTVHDPYTFRTSTPCG